MEVFMTTFLTVSPVSSGPLQLYRCYTEKQQPHICDFQDPGALKWPSAVFDVYSRVYTEDMNSYPACRFLCE